jgi:hypothetical protein
MMQRACGEGEREEVVRRRAQGIEWEHPSALPEARRLKNRTS